MMMISNHAETKYRQSKILKVGGDKNVPRMPHGIHLNYLFTPVDIYFQFLIQVTLQSDSICMRMSQSTKSQPF